MSETIIAALISGCVTLIGAVLAIVQTSKKQSNELEKAMAVVQTEISSMKEDIKSHNRYAQMFQDNIPAIKQHMTDVDRRLDTIDRKMDKID